MIVNCIIPFEKGDYCIYARETLIAFDEVQLYPKARGLIKYLVEDGRYDYIETGSLVSIRKNVESIVIPSEERSIRLDPMDFEEFLWALGDSTSIPYLRDCFDALKTSRERLFYYSRADRDNRGNRMEIDFLTVQGRCICPIEVKSADSRFHVSLDKFRSKFGEQLGRSIVLAPRDVRQDGAVVCLPLPMAMFV